MRFFPQNAYEQMPFSDRMVSLQPPILGVWNGHSASPHATVPALGRPVSSDESTNSNDFKVKIPRQAFQPSRHGADGESEVFRCKTCGKTCGRQYDLDRHHNVVHKQGTELACGKCSHKNWRKDKMVNHCRAVHKAVKGEEVYGKEVS